MMPIAKERIDQEGNFLPFSGISIISKVNIALSGINSDSYEFWQSIYKLLSKNLEVKKYFTILPFDSWHMTLSNLYNHHSTKLKYTYTKNNFCKNISFQNKIANALRAIQIKPKITVKTFLVSNAILLKFSIDDSTKQKLENIHCLLSSFENYKTNTNLNNNFNNNYKKNFNNKIILNNLSRKLNKKYYLNNSKDWHVTMAYQHKKISQSKIKYIDQELAGFIKEEVNNSIILAAARLYYFSRVDDFIAI